MKLLRGEGQVFLRRSYVCLEPFSEDPENYNISFMEWYCPAAILFVYIVILVLHLHTGMYGAWSMALRSKSSAHKKVLPVITLKVTMLILGIHSRGLCLLKKGEFPMWPTFTITWQLLERNEGKNHEPENLMYICELLILLPEFLCNISAKS